MTIKSYTYSKLAAKDLIEIYKYTAEEWNIVQADKYDVGLEKTILTLAENPDMGRECNDIKTGYRRFEYESHIIFYRKRKTDILIIRILHKRRDAVRHF